MFEAPLQRDKVVCAIGSFTDKCESITCIDEMIGTSVHVSKIYCFNVGKVAVV